MCGGYNKDVVLVVVLLKRYVMKEEKFSPYAPLYTLPHRACEQNPLPLTIAAFAPLSHCQSKSLLSKSIMTSRHTRSVSVTRNVANFGCRLLSSDLKALGGR